MKVNGNRVARVVSAMFVMATAAAMLTVGARPAMGQACAGQNWSASTPNVWAAGESIKVMLNNDATTNQPTVPTYLDDGNFNPWGYQQHPQAITELNSVWSCPSGTPSITLAGAGRETISFQVFISTGTGSNSALSDVSVVISPLTGAGTLTSDNTGSSNVTRYLEGYVPYSGVNSQGFGELQANGQMPDPLIPFYDPYDSGNPAVATPFNVQAGTTQGVWVNISIPANQPAGAYTGTVTVTGNGIGTVSIPVNMTVWNGNLPTFDAGSIDPTYADMLKSWLPFYRGEFDTGEGMTCGGPGCTTEQALLGKYQIMGHAYDVDVQIDADGPTSSGCYPAGTNTCTSYTTDGTTSSLNWTAYDAYVGPALTPGGLFSDGTAMRVFDSPLSTAGSGAWDGGGWTWTDNNWEGYTGGLVPAGMQQLYGNYATQISQHFAANHASKGWALPELISYDYDETANAGKGQLGRDATIYQNISLFNQAVNSSNTALSPTWDPSTSPLHTFLTDMPACEESGDVTYYTDSACADHINLSYPGGANATAGYTNSWVTAWSPNPTIFMPGRPGPAFHSGYTPTPTLIAGTGYQYTMDLTDGVPALSTAPVPVERWFYQGGDPVSGGEGISATGVGQRVNYWIAYKYGLDETVPSVGDPHPVAPAPGGLWIWVGDYWGPSGDAGGPSSPSDCANSTSPSPFFIANWGGNGVLFYPGNEVGCYQTANAVGQSIISHSMAVNTSCTSNGYNVCNGISGPVASMGLEQMRRGYEDYEYLYLLGKQSGRQAALDIVNSLGGGGMTAGGQGTTSWNALDWSNVTGPWYIMGVEPESEAYGGNCVDSTPGIGGLPGGLPNGPTGAASSGFQPNYQGCNGEWTNNPYRYAAARVQLAEALGFAPASTVPSIAGLSPSSGINTGGTSVQISGANFTGATEVTFGGVGAASFTVNSATEITAVSPAGSGTVDVQVFGSGGASLPSSGDLYTYVSPVTVTGLSPSSGVAAGGTSVNITGMDFASGAVVLFGTQAATNVVVNSSTSITATAPAGSGTVNVTVTTGNGTSATNSADLYTYEAPPTVTSVSPNSGPIPGGTSVTLGGTGFASGMTVMFGSNAATNVTVNSSTSATVTSPAGSSNSGGAVDVIVTATGTSTINGNDQFTYTSPVTVTGLSVLSGPPAGGTSVVITGTGFTGATAVKFGGNNASFTVNSATQITATSPAGGGTVDVTVTTPPYSSTSGGADRFSYSSAIDSGAFATLPTTAVGSTSASQNVSITLASASAISSITVPPTQNGVEEFIVGSVTGCTVGGGSNAAGTVCTVPITFKPQYPGIRLGALQVNNNGAVIGTAGLAGIGQGPQVAISPGAMAIAVGGGASGVTATPQSVTTAALSVSNNGSGLAMDGAGNLYIADDINCLAYKVMATTNQIVVIAGNYTFASGAVTPSTTPEPALGSNTCPQAIAVDGAGNVYIADAHAVDSNGYPNVVEEVSATTGQIQVIAGGGAATANTTPQPALNVAFNAINSLATDASGNLYISDFFNNLVEKVTPAGQMVAFAGGGSTPVSTTPQAATSAALNGPTGMVMDASGNFYISDQNIGVIEKVNSSGQIVSVAGGGSTAPSTTPQPALNAAISNPAGLAVDGAGDLYIADYSNQEVEQVNPAGQLAVIAGGGGTVPSATSESATSAQLGLIEGVEVDGAGNLYIADGQDIGGGDNMVEKVSVLGEPLSFPYTSVGSTSVPQSINLTNIGNQTLNIASVNAATDFTLQSGGTCTVTATSSQTLASGANCSLTYAFQPTASGPLSETATLTDDNLNASGVQQGIGLIGTATAGGNPQLTGISPSGGNSGTSVTVTGSNLGGATEVTFGSTPVAPTSSTSTTVTAIAPAGSGTVNVTVTTANGTSNAESFTYGEAAAATPMFSPGSGTYTSAQTVTISDATAGVTIYYTTNGSTPTTSSSVYSGPISVSASETLQAIAAATGYTTSATGLAAYTINLPAAATPMLSPAAGTYTSAQTVTISDGTSGATIYYTTNGTTPTTSSSVYSGPITVSATETVEAIATAPSYTTSAVGSAAYTISLPVAAATPTFSPAAGTYIAAQTVTISDATSGAIVYYTTDGTAPTTSSTVYSSPISVSTSETVEAIATASGYTTSAVGSAAYVIAGGGNTPSIALTPGIIGTLAGVQGGTTAPSSGGVASGNSIGAPVGIAVAPMINGAGGDIYFDNCSTAGNCSYNYHLYVLYEGGAAAKAILVANGIASPTVGDTYPISTGKNETGPASLNGITVDSYGNVLVADWAYDRVYMFYAGDISGQGTNPADAMLTANPSANVAAYGLHAGDGYHVADGGHVIGSAPATPEPNAVYVDSAENVFFTDRASNGLVEVVYNTSGTSAATILGAEGYTGLKQGYTYVIAGGQSVTTYPNDNDGGSSVAYNGATAAANTAIHGPWGISADATGNIYFADSGSNKIKKLSASTAVLTTIGGPAAGTATTVGASGDGGLATSAQMHTPYGLVVDNGGSIYFTDTANGSVRKIDQNGYISTVSGISGSSGSYAGDGGNATAATLGQLEMMSIDASGNLYISDRGNDLIDKVSTNAAVAGTVVATAVNNSGQFTYEGSFAFGSQIINTSSSPATALISNISGSSVTLSSINIPSGYTQAMLGNTDVPDCSTTAAIAPGTSCTLALEFSPTVAGDDNGSATVTANGQSVTIAVTGTAVTTTPTFSPTAGTYYTAQTVTISTTMPGATIYYTTSGLKPTTSSSVYSGPITVSASETVKAIATAPGYTTSKVGSAKYDIKAATPTFSPGAGAYSSAQTVTISTTTPSATIYYTTDGTTPTTGSPVYSGPITVSSTEIVQAMATASGYINSAVASEKYTFRATAPTFNPAGGTYSSTQTVTISTTTPSATIYYTTDGSTPTTGSTAYSGPITVSASEKVEAIATASGYTNSAITSENYTLKVATPTLNPAAGTYSSTQTVTISTTTPSATIYYTTDGSAPTTSSTVYSGPITVSVKETVKAIAVKTGSTSSGTGSAVYKFTVATPMFSPAAGTYSSAQTVTISTTTPMTTIYYTTDGKKPTTNSPVYFAPITVSANETVQAMARANGYTNSAVASAAYVINATP